MSEQPGFNMEEAHKYFGVAYNNRVWALLENTERSADEADEMIHAAHASHLHWLSVGNEANRQRGAWMLARAYSEVGMGARALSYAKECRFLTQQHPDKMEKFDFAYSFEAIARASAIAGKKEDAAMHYNQALEAGAKLEEGDKKYFDADLLAGNWGEFIPPSGP